MLIDSLPVFIIPCGPGNTDIADLNDISTSIAAALSEVGVNGHLDVEMDGAKQAETLGPLGDQVEVEVVVKSMERLAA